MASRVTFDSVEIGQGVQVDLREIRDSTGALVTPDSSVGKYENPSQAETEVQPDVVSTGHIRFTFTPDMAGIWHVRIETSGPDIAYEESFQVVESVFTD